MGDVVVAHEYARPFYFAAMSHVSGRVYFVYVLWSVSAGKFYIGISEDPAARLQQHNSGVSKLMDRWKQERSVAILLMWRSGKHERHQVDQDSHADQCSRHEGEQDER